MRATLRAVAAAALALASAGCGDDGKPTAAASSAPATTARPSASARAPSPSPSASTPASPSPTFDPTAPLAMGKTFATADGVATAMVYSYRHNVARTAPRPEEQPGYVWAAIDVKVCAHKPAGEQEHQGIAVSNSPWTLVYADDSQIEASSVGYNQFPEPEYPFGEKAVAWGRCIRGWITYPVPGEKRPIAVEYAPEGQAVAPRWTVTS